LKKGSPLIVSHSYGGGLAI